MLWPSSSHLLLHFLLRKSELAVFNAGRGALQSGITFARIAHLPTPVFPRADRRKLVKEQRQILKQQEDTQRRHLEQALQLHLESSSPDSAQSSGKDNRLRDAKGLCMAGVAESLIFVLM